MDENLKTEKNMGKVILHYMVDGATYKGKKGW